VTVKTRLKKLRVNRVDLVDRGAAPDAHIRLFKSYADEEQDMVEAEGPELYEVNKAQYTTEQRREMAKTGEALPDGSFPIKNAADLMNARQALGRANPADRARVVAHIKTRAKALGVQLPEDFGKNLDHSGYDGQEPTATPQEEPVSDAATEARVAELEKALTTAEAALAEAVAKNAETPVEVTKALEEVRKQNESLSEEIAKLRDASSLTVAVAKAKTFDKLPIEADKFGAVLKELGDKVSQETRDELDRVLAAANESMAKAFTESGFTGGDAPTDPMAQIETLAKAKATEDKTTVAKAMAEVLESDEGRTLYAEYMKTKKASV